MITMVSEKQLHQIMPLAGKKIAVYYPHLMETMKAYSITTPKRQAAFLAQLAHESAQFTYVREIASGTAYEGRADLGNTQVGDGVKFKGRGLIQVTGRANYTELSKDLGLDCVNNPEVLCTPKNACLVSGWFWDQKGLNALADIADFKAITKKINGGYNGYPDRLKFYEAALRVLL